MTSLIDDSEVSDEFRVGYWDADLDLDPGLLFPFSPGDYAEPFIVTDGYSDDYFDGYTVRWFPLERDNITCGNRKDLPKKQRRHDWACLGKDIANHGEKGIVEVLVFACTACGRDWRD